MLKSPERGGLLANNLVFRYNTSQVDDGVGGDEGGEHTRVSLEEPCLTSDMTSSVFPLHSVGCRSVSGYLEEISLHALTFVILV